MTIHCSEGVNLLTSNIFWHHTKLSCVIISCANSWCKKAKRVEEFIANEWLESHKLFDVRQVVISKSKGTAFITSSTMENFKTFIDKESFITKAPILCTLSWSHTWCSSFREPSSSWGNEPRAKLDPKFEPSSSWSIFSQAEPEHVKAQLGLARLQPYSQISLAQGNPMRLFHNQHDTDEVDW